jgi:putative ABC transport system ATP-binding protein
MATRYLTEINRICDTQQVIKSEFIRTFAHSYIRTFVQGVTNVFWFKRNKTKNASNGRYENGNERLIELRQVAKIYEGEAGTFVALIDVDLQVDPGEFVAVIGKSGSGKSTLINMITGIDHPTSGEVLVGDTAVHNLNEGQIAVWRGKNIGVVFQFFQLLPTLTVVENIMLPMDFCDMYRMREREDRAMDLLEQVEMSKHAYKLPTGISGGEQQRVAIARALANDPPIIVADEPTGNLDSNTANSIINLFENLVANGKTILMVTHDLDLAQRASRTITLADGKIIRARRTKSGLQEVLGQKPNQPGQSDPDLSLESSHA